MNYEIRKGWPAAAAIDLVVTPNETIIGGNIVGITTNGGELIVGPAITATSEKRMATFGVCIDTDELSGDITVLAGMFVVEVTLVDDVTVTTGDVIGDFTVGVVVSSDADGLFHPTTGADAAPQVLGRVIETDGVSKFRVLWLG